MANTFKQGSWYNIVSQDNGENEVYIYDAIGAWGITAKDFVTELGSLKSGSKLTVRINSPGGDVFDALAIFNVLSRRSENVVTYVDGMAASAASIIFMAGKERVMPENAYLMIHNPWTVAMGTSDDLAKAAEDVARFQNTLVNVYVASTGQDADDVQEMMDAETWLNAEDAKRMNFAHRIDGAIKLAACFKPALYRNIPAVIAATFDEKEHRMADEPTKDGSQPRGDVPDVKPDAPAAVASVVKQPADSRAEFKEFVAKFGAERAARYFADGLSLELAGAEYVKELEADNAKLKASGVVPAAPAALSDEPTRSDKTWAEALSECGGDYVKARKSFPDAYSKYMNNPKEKQK